MNGNFFFTNPSHTNTDIHVVFTYSYDNDIVFFSEPHFCCFFRHKKCPCYLCSQPIISINISIMNAWYTMLHNIGSNKAFASYKCSHLTKFLPNYIIPFGGGVSLSKLNNWSR